jgi:hypothetical protein
VPPTPTATPTPEASFDVELHQGWNLVSLPLNTTTSSPRDILSAIEGVYETIFAWDSASQTWLSFSPALPDEIQSLTSLGPTQGFWLNAAENATLHVEGSLPGQTSIALATGWNLVGFPSLTPQDADTALATIAGKFSVVYGYEPTDPGNPWKRYDPSAPPFARTLQTLQPGRGYWIKATEPCNWTIGQ